MTFPKILVVDDDPLICNLVTHYLSNQNYETQSAFDGKSALAIFYQFKPNLVILDVNLPDTLGYNLCEQMRYNNNVFIIMLTSRSELNDKKQGFLKGADDYLTKPFDLEELGLRVNAVLKRQGFSPPQKLTLVFDNLIINPITRQIKFNNGVLELTTLEFDLLYCLASIPGKVWSREELKNELWKNSTKKESRAVDMHIAQIRKQIAKCSFGIITVRGIGYKFERFSNL